MKDRFRLVQTGDLHLGSPFAFAPAQADLLAKTQLQTFWSIIQLCQEQQADVLLITGDFFDQPQPDARLVRTIKEMLASLNTTRVLIAPGNHDPYSLESPYRDTDWPDSVTIFDEHLKFVEWSEHQVRIYGLGFTATVAPQPLLSGQTFALDPAFANVLLLHADLTTGSSQSPYNPVSLQDLSGLAFDYVALGHIHQYSGLLSSGSTTAAYAGCPFGRGFDETGAKGIIVGDLQLAPGRQSRHPGEPPRPIVVKPALQFLPLGNRQFVDMTVEISGVTDQQAIADQILQAIEQAQGPRYRDDFYKIRLVGQLPDGFSVLPDILDQKLAGQVSFIKLKDKTRPALDLDALAGEHALRGAFVRQARSAIERAAQGRDPQSLATAELALEIGLRAMQGEGVQYAAE